MITEKKCTRCKKVLPKDMFYIVGSKSDKLRTPCIKCTNEIARFKWANDPYFKNKKAADNKKRYHEDEEYRAKKNIHSNELGKRIRARHRVLVLSHYSGDTPKCACCGEDNVEFLTIDHINGGGNDHRRSIGRGNINRWLIKNNFPEGYQVLCMNCNWGRRTDGVCPHKK